MEIKDISPQDGVYIVIETSQQATFLSKSELDAYIRDGSIEPGMYVIQVTVHNVFKAKQTVELVNASAT